MSDTPATLYSAVQDATASLPDTAFALPDPTDDAIPEIEVGDTASVERPRDEQGRFTTDPLDAAFSEDGEGAPAAESETPEGQEPDVAGESEPAPAFTVDIPLPNGNGENGLRNAGLLNLTVPDQETADTLRFHLKRSRALDEVQSEAERLREDAAFAPFFQTAPVAGFATLAQRQPEAFADFLGHAVAAYPAEIAAMLERQGFTVAPAKDAEVIEARAALAKRELRDLQATAQQTYHQTMEQQQLVTLGGRAVRAVAETLGLPLDPQHDEFQEFATRAARELDKWMDRQPAGARPTEHDLQLALQPLAQRFAALRSTPPATKAATRTASASSPAKAPVQTPEQMQAKAAKAAEYRKLQPGQAASAVTGKVKIRPDATIKDLAATLRGR